MNDEQKQQNKLQRFARVVTVLGAIGFIASSWTAVELWERGRKIAELKLRVGDLEAHVESLKKVVAAANDATIDCDSRYERLKSNVLGALNKPDEKPPIEAKVIRATKAKPVPTKGKTEECQHWWRDRAESCQREIDDRIAEAKRDYQAKETALCFPVNESGPYLQCHKIKRSTPWATTTIATGQLTVECDHNADGYVIPSRCRVKQ